ncbi:MAG: SemiSWEET transporter [Deltaproteobacteria bacterium]
MTNITWLGFLAGTVTSISVIPQVVKAYKTRHVRDISIWQPVLLDFGMCLWLLYGIIIGDIPLILANIFSIFCNSILILMKIFFEEDDNSPTRDYISGRHSTKEEV